MKKTVSLILILVMCLSFCACGGNQNIETTGAQNSLTGIYEKYAYLLELLEAGDFAAARREMDRLAGMENGGSVDVPLQPVIPVPTTPPTTAAPKPTEESWRDVEITVDNFYDYFKPIHVLQVERNGFGELECVNLYTNFVLRDGLTADGEKSKLALRYWNTWCDYPLITDAATGEISLGEPIRYTQSEGSMAVEDFVMGYCYNGEYTFYLYAAAASTYSPEDTVISTVCMEDYIIMEVLGTVRLKGEPTDERFNGMVAQG